MHKVRITKERTLRKKMTIESKKFVAIEEEESQIPPDIIAKIRNDKEFNEAATEEVTPELFAAFVAKQLVNNDLLKKQVREAEQIQAEKKARIAELHEKLHCMQYMNKSETEDSTPRNFNSPNLKDPQYWKLEKLK